MTSGGYKNIEFHSGKSVIQGRLDVSIQRQNHELLQLRGGSIFSRLNINVFHMSTLQETRNFVSVNENDFGYNFSLKVGRSYVNVVSVGSLLIRQHTSKSVSLRSASRRDRLSYVISITISWLHRYIATRSIPCLCLSN